MATSFWLKAGKGRSKAAASSSPPAKKISLGFTQPRSPARSQAELDGGDGTPKLLEEQADAEKLRQSAAFLEEQQRDPGFTLLHYVALLGHTTLAPALLVATPHNMGRFTRIASYLVRTGHEVFVQDKYGCIPLQLAAATGNGHMINVLLSPFDELTGVPRDDKLTRNQFLNHQDSQIRFTALHAALNHGQHKVAVLLLQHGANPQLLDITRYNAFQVAPNLEALQDLLHLVVQHEDVVPTPAVAQLMIEVIGKQEQRAKTERQKQEQAVKAAIKERGGEEEKPQNMQQWAKAFSMAPQLGNLDYTQRTLLAAMLPIVSKLSSANSNVGNTARAMDGAAAGGGGSGGGRNSSGDGAQAAPEHATGEVAEIVRRLFRDLYSKQKYDDIWEYVRAAVDYNNYRLTQLMLDTICSFCPKALAECSWEGTLGPLIACFPDLFHNLIHRLQGMPDNDVIGFVKSLRMASYAASSISRDVRASATATASQPSTAAFPGAPGSISVPPRLTSSSSRSVGRSSAHLQAKILLYQQLVEGLKRVNYVVIKAFFEHTDQDVLNDMAQYPIFKDFVNLIATKKASEGYTASDSGRHRLLELLRKGDNSQDDDGREQGPPPGPPPPPSKPSPDPHHAQHGTHRLRLTSGLPPPRGALRISTAGQVHDAEEGGSGQSAAAAAAAAAAAGASGRGRIGPTKAPPPTPIPGGGLFNSPVPSPTPGQAPRVRFMWSGRASPGRWSFVKATTASMTGPMADADKLSTIDDGEVDIASASAVGTLSFVPPHLLNREQLAVQNLDVRRVLTAAVRARKSMNMEATVKSITAWVDINSKDKRATQVFISGIHTALLKEMAMRFPSSSSKLFNLVSREVLEQLTTLQVSASLLHRKDQVVKCSDVRNAFTWRAPELKQLADEKGFAEDIVDALADYGIPFECTFKAAMAFNTTKEHFAALIDAQFTGPELKDLISNDIQLSRITDAINVCSQPPGNVAAGSWKTDPMTALLKDMLKEKLSFRIVEAILDAGSMNEATVFTNFRPGNQLFNVYPPELYRPKYTHHFVQLLLTHWKRGQRDGQGNWVLAPWDKRFIDTIFAPNDPLSTALKSAYDNKLKDTPVYLDSTTDAVHGWAKKQRKDLELVLAAFVCNPLLIHRWPVFILLHLLLFLYDTAKTTWQALGFEWGDRWAIEQQGHSIDAKALVIPWQGIADVGDQMGMLTGLIDVDVPVRWFGFTAIKAAITVQWQAFGQTLMLMGSLAHITFMVLFGVLMLVIRRHGEHVADHDMSLVRKEPEVIALLVVLGLLSFGGLLEEAFQMMQLTWKTWRNYLGNLIDLTSFSLFVVLFGMVWAGFEYDTILAVGAIETLVLFVRLVFFASMTDSMGSLMRMVIEIIKDMRYFFLLLGMIFGGFAISFAILKGGATPYAGVAIKLFTIMLGDFQQSDVLNMLQVGVPGDDHVNLWYMDQLAVFMWCGYAILIGIVLVNLLIAIMNDTYDRIKETEEVEVLHNRARLIVDLESLLTDKMRDALQKRLLGRYLHILLPADSKMAKYMAGDAAGDGDWKGRLRHMREIIKSDFEPLINKTSDKLRTDLMKKIETIEKWVKDQPDLATSLHEAAGGSGPASRR